MSNPYDTNVNKNSGLFGLGSLGSLPVSKEAIWAKGRMIPDFSPLEWRWDDNGSVIKFSDYGNRTSPYGWEIDHHPIPTGLGGADNITNCRPLHWKSNASHGAPLGNALSGL